LLIADFGPIAEAELVMLGQPRLGDRLIALSQSRKEA